MSDAALRDERLSEASLLIGLQEYDRADELLRAVVADADRSGDRELASIGYEALGTIATRLGREGQARVALELALERGEWPDPARRTQLYFELARILSFAGDFERAIGLLDGALERLDAEADADVRVTLSVALSYACDDAGQPGRANEVLASLLRSGAQDLDALSRGRVHYAMARLALSRGRLEQGIEHGREANHAYREAGEEYMLANSLLLYANLLLDNSSTAEAGEALREARALYGPKIGAVDLGFLLVEEAHYHLQMGDAARAAELAREAVEALAHLSVPSELADAYLVLARAYEELGELERAERAYSAAVDCAQRTEGFPRELSRAYRWYGKFLRRQGRDEAALEMLERAAELELH